MHWTIYQNHNTTDMICIICVLVWISKPTHPAVICTTLAGRSSLYLAEEAKMWHKWCCYAMSQQSQVSYEIFRICKWRFFHITLLHNPFLLNFLHIIVLRPNQKIHDRWLFLHIIWTKQLQGLARRLNGF